MGTGDSNEEGFFEDDCEVLDFASQRVWSLLLHLEGLLLRPCITLQSFVWRCVIEGRRFDAFSWCLSLLCSYGIPMATSTGQHLDGYYEHLDIACALNLLAFR